MADQGPRTVLNRGGGFRYFIEPDSLSGYA